MRHWRAAALAAIGTLPIGVLEDETVEEGTARLEPGDSLLVYSDGLVERGDDTLELSDIVRDVGTDAEARDVVGQLMGTVPAQPGDDVTVVVLCRLPGPGPAAEPTAPEPATAGRR
jgi:serine phosphatase RsbU (regulator of sigma subunit)